MTRVRKIIAICLTILLSSQLIGCSSNIEFAQIRQANKNYLDISIDLNEKVPEKANTLKVEANMYYKKQLRQTVTKTLSLDDKLSFEVPYFGKWDVKLELLDENNKTLAKQKQEVAVTASEYNIAPLIATMPVLIFSLKYFYEIPTVTDNNNPIPTIVTLARDNQYDYDKLPENMYVNPYLTKNDKSDRDFDVLNAQRPMIAQYVKDLYELDNISKFNFYINDLHMAKIMPEMVFQNGIPEQSYTLTLITDGTRSYYSFRETYGNTKNASELHEKLVEEYKKEKEEIKNGKVLNDAQRDDFGKYIYACLDEEPQAKWWVIRKSGGDTFKIEDEDFLKKVIEDDRVSNNYINNLLAKVEENNKTAQLKSLYKFEDDVYVKANQENKTPLMILGTSIGVEKDNPIDEYIQITQAIYGEDYLYIYKGHPGNIPSEERVKEMNDRNIEVVDASIAAELFLFYHPETKLIGYPSSTFLSANEDNCFGLYLLNKNRALTTNEDLYQAVKDYASMMDVYISDLDLQEKLDNNLKIDQKIYDAVPKDDHHYYLIEFVDNQQYDIAIWDQNQQSLKYYKLQDNTYIEVNR